MNITPRARFDALFDGSGPPAMVDPTPAPPSFPPAARVTFDSVFGPSMLSEPLGDDFMINARFNGLDDPWAVHGLINFEPLL